MSRRSTRRNNRKRFYVLDPETPLESFFTGVGTAGLVVAFFAFMMTSGQRPSFTWEEVRWPVLGGVVLGLAGFLMRYLTDERYLVYRDQRELHFLSRIGPWTRQRLVARFADVEALAVSGTYHESKQGSYWSYQLYAQVGKKLVRLTDPARSYPSAVAQLKDLSGQTGIRFYDPQAERVLVLVKGEPEYR